VSTVHRDAQRQASFLACRRAWCALLMRPITHGAVRCLLQGSAYILRASVVRYPDNDKASASAGCAPRQRSEEEEQDDEEEEEKGGEKHEDASLSMVHEAAQALLDAERAVLAEVDGKKEWDLVYAGTSSAARTALSQDVSHRLKELCVAALAKWSMEAMPVSLLWQQRSVAEARAQRASKRADRKARRKQAHTAPKADRGVA